MKEPLKKELSQEIDLVILDNKYTIKFPNNGQFIRIQTQRIRLSDGTYEELLLSSSDALYARFLIDAIATFTELIPSLNKDLNKSIFELSLMESKSIVKAYTKTYLPWYNSWTQLIQLDEDELIEDEK